MFHSSLCPPGRAGYKKLPPKRCYWRSFNIRCGRMPPLLRPCRLYETPTEPATTQGLPLRVPLRITRLNYCEKQPQRATARDLFYRGHEPSLDPAVLPVNQRVKSRRLCPEPEHRRPCLNSLEYLFHALSCGRYLPLKYLLDFRPQCGHRRSWL